jgi:hypothetical protein
LKAYLDFNIIVAIKKGELSIDSLRKIDSNISEFPFSASHIQEIDNIFNADKDKRETYINQHLQTVAGISNNLYFYQNLKNEVQLINEPPSEVLKTIREVPFAKTAMQSFTNLVSADQKEELRKMLGINPNEINNYSPSEVVEQLNTVLTNSNLNCTFFDLIENGIKTNPQGHTFGLSERFAAVYEMLDLLGYWKDKQTSTSNYARLWDSNHAFFAAHCDYFISDDLRNRYKAKVTYSLFNIRTTVIGSNGQ